MHLAPDYHFKIFPGSSPFYLARYFVFTLYYLARYLSIRFSKILPFEIIIFIKSVYKIENLWYYYNVIRYLYEVMMNWLDNIKKIKKKKGLTNEALSALSSISQGTLNKLLSGASEDPKLSTLTALKDALGVSFDEMMYGDDAPTQNYEMIKKYSELDNAGRETVDYMINKEHARVISERENKPYALDSNTRRLKLFNTAASAGTGMYLDGDGCSDISVYSNPITDAADFAVRVSGDSMMPKYHDGDVLLVEQTEQVEIGDLGIFAADGESFFKKFGGDRLISLNPKYSDLPISSFSDVRCFGRVIGKLRR